MGWKENLQPASYRGAGFFVDAADGEVGRRQAVHEYPGRDLPWVEDLGRKARIFRVKAFVIGADYMAKRDALLAACEQRGPGTLVHPYHGTMQVACQVCTYTESKDKGGKAEFALTFIETGQRLYPSAQTDYSEQATQAAQTARQVAGEAFAQVYETSGPAWLAAASAGDFRTALAFVRQVATTMPSVLDGAAMDGFLAGLATAAANVEALVAAGPAAVTSAVASAVVGLAALDSGAGLAELAKFGAPNARAGLAYIPATTATRARQAANQDAFAALVRRLAVTSGVEAALAADYQSHEDAAAARAVILDSLDQQIEAAGEASDDACYQALSDLYVSTARAFSSLALGLPHLRAVELPPAPQPALVLAYDLYGDLSRAEQIAAMNKLPHPGLPPAGETIMVLDA